MEQQGLDYAKAIPDMDYKYNVKELHDENGLDWSNYGARFYDSAIARFNTVDRFAGTFPSWSPYHYANNNPISNIDINGDSTRVYHESGNYLYSLNNDLPNEDHFYSTSNLRRLHYLKEVMGESKLLNGISKSISNFYVGAKTRADLKEYSGLREEHGLGFVKDDDRQLRLVNLDHLGESFATQFILNTTELRFDPIYSRLKATGHSQPGSSEPSPPGVSRTNPSGDFNALLESNYNSNYGPHPLFISGKNDYSIYKSGYSTLFRGQYIFMEPQSWFAKHIQFNGNSSN